MNGRLILIALFATLLVSTGAGPIAADPDSGPPAACASCERARRTHGWCDGCNLGYVGDVPVPSRHLWHVLDAHGHRLNVENLGCPECSAAAEVDGYCESSRIGFVDGEAYFSRLTWLLARSPREHEMPDCPICAEHRERHGWCAECGIGHVGRYVLDERTDYEALVADMEMLAIANDAARRCEHCAVAIVTDSQCPFCRIRYSGGQPISADPQDQP